MLGQMIKMIANGKYHQGFHRIPFYAGDLCSGIYFYSVEVSEGQGRTISFQDVRKMVLIK
jgi:hypothetical protein